jgi:antitoxin VapB
MSLNIKNEEAHRLAQELSRITGESMTVAVSEAIKERLQRVRGQSNKTLAERLLKIGEECASHLEEPYKSMNIDELLYDEQGLPK